MAGPRARGTVAQRLAAAARTAFSALRDAHPSEHFYFFALFTTDAGEYVTTTAWSEEAFARVDNRDFRFWPAESPYHSTHGTLFDDFNPGSRLHEACFAALGLLDAEGFFGTGATRANVLVNVVYGDMSDEQWLAHAQRLNPPEAVAAALPYLRLNLPEGDVKQWGAGVYQVSGLSLSSDRRVVAYTGMGGEVGILSTSTRTPSLEGTFPMDLFAGLLSADGARLFVGHKQGIGFVDTQSGRSGGSVAEGGCPHSLALAPDGTRLAVVYIDGPLTVVDLETNEARWTRAAVIRACIAFSPDGLWLAAATTDRIDEEWQAKVTLLDAATGAERWSVSVGRGWSASLAWMPDGTELLVGTADLQATPEHPPGALSFLRSGDGQVARTLRWNAPADAVAVSPGGRRIGVCARTAIVMLTTEGVELGRGRGGQRSLDACAFVAEDTLLAAGRDVNTGPAILELHVPV